ncbi:DUF397 domain-containing protein [Streptomyces sp. NPDC059578]|uniref:DUF397 domain-containing protein n=1 Tax=unclassified Streptomyces TaxID=2593676 RepID=UPI00365D7229
MSTIGQDWVKSSYSNGNTHNCVEVRGHGNAVQFRDSKRGESGPIVAVAARSWSAFVADLSDANQT